MTDFREIARKQLKIDEGVKPYPYTDTVGKLTIGVGRNLADVGLRPKEIDFLLDNDIGEAVATARHLVSSFDALSEPRKAVLVNMAFNLGYSRLSGFLRMLQAIRDGRFADAAHEMRDSDWAVQVGPRAERLAKIMEDSA